MAAHACCSSSRCGSVQAFRSPTRRSRSTSTRSVSPAARAAHPGQPVALEDFRDQIETTLTGQRVDQEMDTWLKEARRHTEIVVSRGGIPVSRRRRLPEVRAACICILVLAAIVCAFLVVREPMVLWKVRQRIVATVEEATGGRTEIGCFRFDLETLRAEVAGLRPARYGAAGQAAAVPRDQCRGRAEDRLAAEARRGHPVPGRRRAARLPDRQPGRQHQRAASRRSNRRTTRNAVETLLKLAIGRFSLQNGVFEVEARGRTPFEARGRESQCALHLRAAGAALSRRSLDPARSISVVRLRARARSA